MTTDALARTFIDDIDQLPEEIPGAATLEPGRLSWLHGATGQVKTPGVFYAKDTAFVEPPVSPWVLDERYTDQGETGYNAPELRIAFIANRSQWFLPGQDRGDLPEWLNAYQEGAKKLTEYLIQIDGIYEPMVLSVSGKYKAGPIADILSTYRRGALAQAMRKVKRTLPAWSFWLPIANKRGADLKTVYLKASDADGKEYGSVVTPPALIGPPQARTAQELIEGAAIWQEYQDWAHYTRAPQGTTEGAYTISTVPQLPAGRNVPQPVTAADTAPQEGDLF
jgi:hypothetical protein